MFRRVLVCSLLVLSASTVAAQTGPQLATVFPPGAKAGETVEVTVAGSGFDGGEQLLFSDKKLKAELVAGSVGPDSKSKGGGNNAMVIGNPTVAKFKIAVPKDARLGMHDVRIVSKSGLSNPRAFVVGSMTDVSEKEPNNDTSEAQLVELNATVNGVIASPTDVDYLKIKAKAGQGILVYCLATSIDSRLQAELMVVDPAGKPVAANRGYRGGDAVLDFLPAADGEYLIRVSQFAYTTGGPDHFYRLTVTTDGWDDVVFPPLGPSKDGWESIGRNLPIGKPDPRFPRLDGRPLMVEKISQGKPPTFNMTDLLRVVPPTAAMLDLGNVSAHGMVDGNPILRSTNPIILDNGKNDTPETAQVVTVPCDIAGRIEKKFDRDYYIFEAKKGEVWTLEVFCDRIGSPGDAYFVLSDEKGKVITEVDDGPDTLSPNQFYSKSDDPGRYRFNVPADGKYRVMVSTREAAVQFGVREQYVLRIAKENPDFRLAVMAPSAHYPDAGTLPKNGAVHFNVYIFRMDGFDDPITLTAADLPKGVTCVPQTIASGQSRGTLVFTAEKDAAEWAGFVKVVGTAGNLKSEVRPFSVVWSIPGLQPNQPPQNIPMITRMDRGPGLALAVAGEAPFKLTPKATAPIKVKTGEKVEVTLTVERKAEFKDAIQVFSATPGFGPRQQGNNPPTPIGTADAGKEEVKLSIDLPQNVTAGTYTLVLTGKSGVPAPKGNNAKPVPSYPTTPITVVVEKK